MRKFTSIQTQLTVNTMLIISVIFVAVLSFVAFINIRTLNKSVAKSERHIRGSLIAKGNTLANNNCMAMGGMAEDNAFTAIRMLVSETVKHDPDIVYGIYMDRNSVAWAYAVSEEASGKPAGFAPLNDDMSLWAASLSAPDHKTHIYEKEEVIEFAAPVRFEDDILGFIRYGISTESMREALRETLAEGIRARNQTLSVLLFMGFLSLLASYLIVKLFARRLTRPIAALADSARTIAEGNYDVPVTSDSNDELGLLVADVDRMRVAIRELTDQMREKERLKREMEIARKIQTSLLPDIKRKNGNPDFDIVATMSPAEEVGGDYYDIISVEEYDWLVIGDVSGHGVTSGLVMMMVQTAIHTVLNKNPSVSPSRLLSVINRTIYENIEKMGESKHMTILVLAAGKDGSFTFSGLHEDILIRRAETGRIETVETDGMWIGLEPDISGMLSDNSLRLETGDCMVLFTDGITEAPDKNGDFFGNERLIDIVEKSGDRPAWEIHESVLRELEAYQKPDDVTLVVIKRLK